MLKIIYFIKSEKSKNNDECPIYAKISYQGKSITMSTGKYINKARWQSTSNLRGALRSSTYSACSKNVEPMIDFRIREI